MQKDTIVSTAEHDSDVDEELVSKNLYTEGIDDPNLIIRTSGEERISNYLLWQLAYTEFHFAKKNWPDFNEQDLEEAIKAYSNRHRRFGGA